MDYVKPLGVVESMLAGGTYKLNVPPRHLVIRGMLAGAYLGIATSMAVTVAVETGSWIAGSPPVSLRTGASHPPGNGNHHR